MVLLDNVSQKKLKSYFKNGFFPPSEKEVDSIIKVAIENFAKLSYQGLGLDVDETMRDPMVVFGPRIDHQGGVDIIYKKGQDKEVRYSLIDIAVLQFTKTQLGVYRCALDLISGRMLNKTSKEYFYKDIVSISIETETYTKTKKRKGILGNLFEMYTKQVCNVEKFVLKNSGGESLVINISNDETSDNERLSEDFSNVVIAVKKLIQNKK